MSTVESVTSSVPPEFQGDQSDQKLIAENREVFTLLFPNQWLGAYKGQMIITSSKEHLYRVFEDRDYPKKRPIVVQLTGNPAPQSPHLPK